MYVVEGRKRIDFQAGSRKSNILVGYKREERKIEGSKTKKDKKKPLLSFLVLSSFLSLSLSLSALRLQ